jgi:transcription elongation factor GreB
MPSRRTNRPDPAATPTRLITPAGYRRLREELEQLWKVERPKVTHEVSEAAALGDRSENAEYIYGKRRLREIDRRLRYLSKLLDDLTVVRFDPSQQGRVFFGAWVTLEDEEGATLRYRIVGPDEIDVRAGKVSVDSPMGRALIGKRVDDEVSVVRPKGRATFSVLAIEYEREADALEHAPLPPLPLPDEGEEAPDDGDEQDEDDPGGDEQAGG